MPQSILVSFCNNPTRTASPLVCLQASSSDEQFSFAPVAVGFPDAMISCTGLAHADGRIYTVFIGRSGKVYVSALDEGNFCPLFVQELPDVRDPHSILPLRDSLYVVSTGTDELICYDIREGGIENPRVVWRASDMKTDTHHVNSVVEKDGEILVSAFGPKEGMLWATSLNGYVHNVTSGTPALTGLHHPHSLSVRRGRLYYSDSHSNSFCGAGEKDPMFQLNGYTRGVAWLDDTTVCLGTSIGRRISKSTGLIANPTDPGEPAGECGLWLCDVSAKQVTRKIDLSWFGPEIYDLVVLDVRPDLLAVSNASQRTERQALSTLTFELARETEKGMQEAEKQAKVAERLAKEAERLAKETERLAIQAEGWHQRAVDVTAELDAMKNSRAWHVAMLLKRLYAWLAPVGSRRARLIQNVASLLGMRQIPKQ